VRGLHIYILLAVAALALVFADRLSSYWMHVAIIAMFYGILASSWSLLAGYAGLFSLGHMAFASIGGYTSALLVQWYGFRLSGDVLRAPQSGGTRRAGSRDGRFRGNRAEVSASEL